MRVSLHANATTTPKIRAYIRQSRTPVAALARELGVSEPTIRKWRRRDQVEDGSHTAHNLRQSTSPTEEALIVELRTTAGLSLDDIVEVMHRCVNPALSRSAIYRCLRRHGIAGRTPLAKPLPTGQFEDTGFGFVHIDLKYLPKLKAAGEKPTNEYVFVAIERSTRFVYAEIIPRRDKHTVAACFGRFLEGFPGRVHTVLSDNGGEFTDRFAQGCKQKPSGNHPIDLLCAQHGIEHRLTRPFHPQTNGMVERFNRRISEAIKQREPAQRNGGKNKFNTRQQRRKFIRNFVKAYNNTRLRCLKYTTPIQTLNNQTKYNTFAGMTAMIQHRAAPDLVGAWCLVCRAEHHPATNAPTSPTAANAPSGGRSGRCPCGARAGETFLKSCKFSFGWLAFSTRGSKNGELQIPSS